MAARDRGRWEVGIENRMTYKGERKENEWDLVADLCEVMKDKKGGGI